ncbi:bifunctional riboflavin kinase/FAD synthetase [Schumannella sp. 10F1B-5-1]|uniref:bifunctional riboflavin kinase/FAD synthetase n=1 Tax=Schumannella sp. 10F1B-5-1 TaxID=2590780 RepID=UPI00113137BA|nr:bifunctional riboflavin kinase/FAD synthetase [Schumannella sp. 10F1B-5-1]TPW70738.1 bifunctional riboflavin kinase/FAD synthetase [Schumannella sp. 10F1B-5-1]
MSTFHGIAEVPADFGPSAVTIGKFDGVHLGHQAVIGRLRDEAHARDLVPSVITFDRNPLALLDPASCPPEIVGRRQELELLHTAGAEAVIELAFDEGLRDLSPEAFVRDILVGAANARLVLIGRDFRFGARGAGDVDALRTWGAELGFDVIVVDDVAADGRRVSSTELRALLDEGRVAEAAGLLGRLHAMRGGVVHGEARGRELGYRTANLSPDAEGMMPADGVYAAWASVDGRRVGAAVSVGVNPTFGDVTVRRLEAHLLDETLDLYDRELEIAFVEFIRPMRKFADADALVAQMHADEVRIREILGYPAPASSAE